MNLPIFDCLIDENLNNETGIYAISFVDAPANEVDFVALSKQGVFETHLKRDAQKQVLTGVVLCPDQLIYRQDERLGEYYIRFSASEIEKIARKMMKAGIALQSTTHEHQAPLEGNYLSELWIVEDPTKDKSLALGFAPQSKGTLMCSYKIEDRHYWQTQVMTGKVKGFSLEGFFIQHATKQHAMNKQTTKMNKKQNKQTSTSFMSKLAALFLDISTVQRNDVTSSGDSYLVFDLSDGKEIRVDADGFVTLDGEQLPSGQHLLSDGCLLVVDDEGQFVETKESTPQNTLPDEATAPQTLGKDAPALPAVADESEVDSTEALKAKIATLESKLSELASLAQEANTEVQKLRKTMPSTLPAVASDSPKTATTRHQQMANALSHAICGRKKH